MARSLAREAGIVFQGHREVAEKPRMNPQKRTLIWINALGGIAVLGSYAWSVLAHPGSGGDFWGGVPAAMQSGYTVTMLLAVAGYFAFTRFVFRLRPAQVKIADRFDYRSFQLIYALILVPSALWMPAHVRDDPGPQRWPLVRDPCNAGSGRHRLTAVGGGAAPAGAQRSQGRAPSRRVGERCLRLPDGGSGRTGVAGLFPRLGHAEEFGPPESRPLRKSRRIGGESVHQARGHRALRLAGREGAARLALAGAAGRSRLHPPLRMTVLP